MLKEITFRGRERPCNASDGWSSERSGSVVGAVSPLRLTWQWHATAFPISQWSRATLKNASRRAARTGKVGSVRMRERSSFGRAQRGEEDYGTSEKWHKRRDQSVGAERRRRSCLESSLVINGRSRSMGGGWTRLIRTKRTDAKGTDATTTNEPQWAIYGRGRDSSQSCLVLGAIIERLRTRWGRGEASRLIDIDVE